MTNDRPADTLPARVGDLFALDWRVPYFPDWMKASHGNRFDHLAVIGDVINKQPILIYHSFDKEISWGDFLLRSKSEQDYGKKWFFTRLRVKDVRHNE